MSCTNINSTRFLIQMSKKFRNVEKIPTSTYKIGDNLCFSLPQIYNKFYVISNETRNVKRKSLFFTFLLGACVRIFCPLRTFLIMSDRSEQIFFFDVCNLNKKLILVSFEQSSFFFRCKANSCGEKKKQLLCHPFFWMFDIFGKNCFNSIFLMAFAAFQFNL